MGTFGGIPFLTLCDEVAVPEYIPLCSLVQPNALQCEPLALSLSLTRPLLDFQPGCAGAIGDGMGLLSCPINLELFRFFVHRNRAFQQAKGVGRCWIG